LSEKQTLQNGTVSQEKNILPEPEPERIRQPVV
jgi:hypothetical protein